MKKTLAVLLAAAMLVAMLAGCGNKTNGDNGTNGGAGAETGPDGRTVAAEQKYRTLYKSEVSTLNYLYSSSEIDMTCGVNCTMTLYASDCYGVLRPCAATGYDVSDDGLTYTFHIREGQKWYDYQGNEKGDVTANDWVSAVYWVADAVHDSGSSYSVFTIKNAEAYYDQTSAIMGGETPTTNLQLSDIGIHATDDYTLVFELEQPCPYFVSTLEFGCYFPVAQACLDEYGDKFASDNMTMWFCGPYIMSQYEPQQIHTYVKNDKYWDAEHVYITEIEEQYNSEATALQNTMFLSGEVDATSISDDLLDEWLGDAEKSQMLSTTRVRTNYSYFWGLNFEPRVTDTDHNDEVNAKWIIAVNNESFRQSLYHGMDRLRALQIGYPTNAEKLLSNTLTPAGFCSYDGKDFAQYGDLAAYANADSYNADQAKEFKQKAIDEMTPLLQAAGYSFPIEIVVQYNGDNDWGQECMVVKQQMEELLGTDYITFTILNFGSSGFLSGTRRCGNYCMQKLNGGADYMDPETWLFITQYKNNYNFAYDTTENLEINTKTKETLDIANTYLAMCEAAQDETSDMAKRYELFANAEAFYLSHAMLIPYSVSGGGYQASKMNTFESPYSSCGWTYLSYVGQKIYTTSMSQSMYDKELVEWEAAKAQAEQAATK